MAVRKLVEEEPTGIVVKKKGVVVGSSIAKVKKSGGGGKRKVYDKPGQRYDTPPKTDALYRFYWSLLKQRGDSEMALRWLLERGAFSMRRATEIALVMETRKKLTLGGRRVK